MDGFLWCAHCGAPHALDTVKCPTTGARLAGARVADRGLEVGTILGKRYRVRACVGEESVALLYDARDRNIGRRVTLKVIDADGVAQKDVIAERLEMEREAQAASAVEHPNVLPILDIGRVGDEIGFLVRPRFSREKLSTRLRLAGSLPPAQASDIARQILSGLHVLHGAGIAHRDLGSHNIVMISREGSSPVAQIAGLGRCQWSRLTSKPDQPSGVHYTAPEIVEKGDADPRSDVFSCGVILFEMLTGRRPFEGATADKVRAAILSQAPPTASRLSPHLEPAWFEIFEHTLARDPANRYPTALALLEAIPSAGRAAARKNLAKGKSDEAVVSLVDTMSPSSSSAGPRSRRDGAGSRCDPYIGRTLGKKYVIESLLGSGSAGAVYRATHVDLHRAVAVKVLHDWNRNTRQFVERFKDEALAASKLDHPNVARILDCGHERDGTLFLVMEFIEGESLEATLAANGPLPQRRAVEIAIDIASALIVAHSAGITHRDIKPENVMLVSETDEAWTLAKVCDFGLAKVHDREAGEELTNHGLVIGSPAYMAPEQVRGLPCDHRTDLYGLGVTLFEMVTGRLPHEAATVDRTFKLKLESAPTKPSTYVEVDPLTEDVILHALEADPDSRHASARELRSELFEVLTSLRDDGEKVVTVSIWPEPQSQS